MITTGMLALPGCGADDKASPPQEPFELDGEWTYLGPSDVPHTLTISDSAMTYADVDGTWSSSWSLKAYDNALDHFQVTFASGSGAYLPQGESMSGTYVLTGPLLTVQLANGLASYPALQNGESCTSASDGAALPDCRLYIKPN